MIKKKVDNNNVCINMSMEESCLHLPQYYTISNGYLTCSNCGYVLQENGKDIRYQYDFNNQLENSYPLYNKKNMNIIFFNSDIKKLSDPILKKKYLQLIKISKISKNGMERKIGRFFQYLFEFKNIFFYSITEEMKYDFLKYYLQLLKKTKNRIRNNIYIIRSIFYLVITRIYKQQYFLESFKMPNENSKEFFSKMMKSIRFILQYLSFPPFIINYTQKLQLIGNQLQFSQEQINYAITILNMIKKKIPIKISHIGVALYIAKKIKINNTTEHCSLKKIAEALFITAEAIRYAYNTDLKKIIKKDIFSNTKN